MDGLDGILRIIRKDSANGRLRKGTKVEATRTKTVVKAVYYEKGKKVGRGDLSPVGN